MRVVYYVQPFGLDHAVPQALALSRRAEVHLVLETAPESSDGGVFGPIPGNVGEGVHPDAWESLGGWLPSELEMRLRHSVRLHRIVHQCPRVLHPRTIAVAANGARFIRTLAPDIVHFDFDMIRSAWMFLGLRSLPIVVNLHDVEVHPGDGRSLPGTIRRTLWYGLARHRVAHLIFHSRYCERLYRTKKGMLRVPSSVVPLGVIDVFRMWEAQHLQTEPLSVLFFGRLTAYKGLQTLVTAAPLVASEIAAVRFIVAGPILQGFVLPRIPALPRSGRFELLTRHIPNELLCELFQRAAVVVVPYDEASQSGVVMTAYAFGKPVVATRVGGLPEAVENDATGILVPPRNPPALAQGLLKLLANPDLRSDMAATIQQRVLMEFSWENHAERVMQVYCSVSRA